MAHANIQVHVEPAKIHLDETFRVTITQDNPKQSADPDLSPLKKNFVLVGSSRNESYAISNQQTHYTLTWTVFLKPRQEGILTIPALKVNGEQTTPININVSAIPSSQNPGPTPSTQENKPVFLTVDVSQKKPFVNQQIIYTAKIYNNKQLLDASYEPPQIDNALVVPLPGKRYQTQKNGIPYLVEERSYAIFPQKSGPLTITPPIFTALIYEFNPQRMKTKNPPLTIHVAPIPKNYSSNDWLPAKDIQLHEEYENTSKTLSQGSTLVRNITLSAVGVPAQLLPTLSFASTKALSVYPEKGKDHNQVVQGELVSQTQMKVTYLFNEPGTVTIPELNLTWFNTKTGQEESSKLPPRTFNISASALTNTQESPTNTPLAHPSTEKSEPVKIQTQASFWPWFVTAFFALAWLFTLFLWLKQKVRPHCFKRASKKTLPTLRKACFNNAPQEARNALLQWAKEQWPDLSFLNLNDLFVVIHDQSFKKQIQLLSQALYQDAAPLQWHGEALWHCVQQFKKTTKPQQKTKEVLPPLNPES